MSLLLEKHFFKNYLFFCIHLNTIEIGHHCKHPVINRNGGDNVAETYRKSKIEHYLERLQVRKQALTAQLEMHELDQSQEFIRGQLSATDLIIREIWAEFSLQHASNERGDDLECKNIPK
jgi:hypothetical protein